MSLERIDKVLSHEGFGSRKDVRRYLRSQSVVVNGNVIFDPSFHIDVDKDELVVDGKKIELQTNVYLMMNKPQNVVCANKDGLHQTVFSLLDDSFKTQYFLDNLHLVGRLDIDTEGLLLFTTDGKLTHRLISPKTNCPKKYFVKLRDLLDDSLKIQYEEKLKNGIYVESEGQEDAFDALPATIEFTKNDDEVYLTIVEGKYHQVKRMFKALGNEVKFLKRVSINNLVLDQNLKPGEYRKMSQDEIQLLEK